MKDPIVEEVHAIRQQIAAECGYDLGRMMEMQRTLLKNWKGKVVTKADLLRRRERVPSAQRKRGSS